MRVVNGDRGFALIFASSFAESDLAGERRNYGVFSKHPVQPLNVEVLGKRPPLTSRGTLGSASSPFSKETVIAACVAILFAQDCARLIIISSRTHGLSNNSRNVQVCVPLLPSQRCAPVTGPCRFTQFSLSLSLSFFLLHIPLCHEAEAPLGHLSYLTPHHV